MKAARFEAVSYSTSPTILYPDLNKKEHFLSHYYLQSTLLWNFIIDTAPLGIISDGVDSTINDHCPLLDPTPLDIVRDPGSYNNYVRGRYLNLNNTPNSI